MSEAMTFLPRADLLTLEELDRLASAFIALGVDKLRITGGEPLVRKGIMTLFASLSRHITSGALRELTLTTNGSQLARFADDLARYGVRRINVSLDTLNAAKFAAITRWGKLAPVLDGIKAAQAAGLRVKINAVALKGVNEDEVFTLTDWCAEQGHDLTFIEVMPMGEDFGDAARHAQYWPLSDLRARLQQRYGIEDLPLRTGGPARYARLLATGQTVGFITPMTHNFCESCNRVRVTCLGEMYMCLGQEDRADLGRALRAQPDDPGLIAAIRAAIARKPKGHDFDYARAAPLGQIAGQMPRHMSHTGG